MPIDPNLTREPGDPPQGYITPENVWNAIQAAVTAHAATPHGGGAPTPVALAAAVQAYLQANPIAPDGVLGVTAGPPGSIMVATADGLTQVDIDLSGATGVTPAMVSTAVNAYLANNPPAAGVTPQDVQNAVNAAIAGLPVPQTAAQVQQDIAAAIAQHLANDPHATPNPAARFNAAPLGGQPPAPPAGDDADAMLDTDTGTKKL